MKILLVLLVGMLSMIRDGNILPLIESNSTYFYIAVSYIAVSSILEVFSKATLQWEGKIDREWAKRKCGPQNEATTLHKLSNTDSNS